MTEKHEVESSEGSRRQLQGLPVIRRNVAGIDLGSGLDISALEE